MLKNKLFSAISIGGLAIGLTSIILIINFVQHELAFDAFHNNVKDIYRVNIVAKQSGNKHAAIAPPMGPALLAQYPEVESMARLRHANDVLVKIGDDEFYEDKIFYADSTFFNVLNFPLIKGDIRNALMQKNSAIISSKLAQKYFDKINPLGKTIIIDNQLEVTVTGIADATTPQSHFNFEMLISFQSFEVPQGYPVTLESWGWTSFPTYIRLKEGNSYFDFNAKMRSFISSNMGEASAERITIELQPLQDIYLHSSDIVERDGIASKGDYRYVVLMVMVGLLIIIIATFNFANLSISLTLRRIKEVGVRKTLGITRSAIYLQSFIEAFALVLFALTLSAMTLEVFNVQASRILGVPFGLTGFLRENWLITTGLVSAIAVSGSLYPALYFSRINPITAFKHKFERKRNKVNVNTILLGGQFGISILLILASVVVNDQMTFMAEKDLGYESDRVVALKMQGRALADNYETTKAQLLLQPFVKSVSASGEMFDGQNGSVPISERGINETDYRISLMTGHFDFSETLGLEMAEGRGFSNNFTNDSSAFILNEAAVKMLGWKDDPIGKQLILNEVWEGEVIGVVKNFHFASLHQEVAPLIVLMPRTLIDHVYVKLGAGDLPQMISQLESTWASMHPDLPFDYTFLDSHVQQLYQSDQKFSTLVYTFSGLAIFLACIGLYGLVAYRIETRQKEIGIRKVLGGSVAHIVMLLSEQFLVLLLVSAVVVIPLAWWYLSDWLNQFAYHVWLSPTHVIMALSGTAIVVMFTLCSRTIKAALSNPVNTLKEE